MRFWIGRYGTFREGCCGECGSLRGRPGERPGADEEGSGCQEQGTEKMAAGAGHCPPPSSTPTICFNKATSTGARIASP
ncbi:hypothetical protein GCM10009578_046850 [Streptomyces rhizosphaericus]